MIPDRGGTRERGSLSSLPDNHPGRAGDIRQDHEPPGGPDGHELPAASIPGNDTARNEPDPLPLEPARAYCHPGLCKRLSPEYRPMHGVPSRIRAEAVQYGNLSREVERLEVFMYSAGLAHIPRRACLCHPRSLEAVKRAKLEARQWTRIHGAVRIPRGGGRYDNIPEAWTLTPEYAREIAAEEPEGRFRFGSATPQRFHHPPRREPPGNLPPELAEYLHRGTGLRPLHLPGLDLVQSSPDLETYRKRLQGWRILALCAPGLEIRPTWRGSGKCGRINARDPALQCLPGVMRLRALEAPGRRLREVDFRACHYQLRRILAGWDPLPDPWNHLAGYLHGAGFHVPPEAVKAMAHPVFSGQGRASFIRQYADLVIDPGGLFDTLREVFPRELRISANEIMRLEALIMADILTGMNRAGIPAGLPLHDSILTPYPEEVRAIMEASSLDITGHILPVKIADA